MYKTLYEPSPCCKAQSCTCCLWCRWWCFWLLDLHIAWRGLLSRGIPPYCRNRVCSQPYTVRSTSWAQCSIWAHLRLSCIMGIVLVEKCTLCRRSPHSFHSCSDQDELRSRCSTRIRRCLCLSSKECTLLLSFLLPNSSSVSSACKLELGEDGVISYMSCRICSYCRQSAYRLQSPNHARIYTLHYCLLFCNFLWRNESMASLCQFSGFINSIPFEDSNSGCLI